MEIKNYEPSDIEIHIKDKGIVLREKSLIALSTNDRKILAIGADAEKMALQNIDGVQVFSPLRRGMVADYEASVIMFKYWIRKTWGRDKKMFLKPRIAVLAPKDMTEVEKKGLEDCMYQSRGRKVFISEGSPERFWTDVMAADDKRRSSYDVFIVIIPEMN
ncbi:MAG: hypothetical protein HDR30_02790 [Lachnospiraceae bacterium]|nr:hypothetical protein [Lachnospiraceae bacterium]